MARKILSNAQAIAEQSEFEGQNFGFSPVTKRKQKLKKPLCPGRCTRGQAAPTRAMEVHLNISRVFGAFPNDDTKGEVPTPRAAERPRT